MQKLLLTSAGPRQIGSTAPPPSLPPPLPPSHLPLSPSLFLPPSINADGGGMHLRVVVRELHGEVHVEAAELSHALLAVELLGGDSVWSRESSQRYSTAPPTP